MPKIPKLQPVAAAAAAHSSADAVVAIALALLANIPLALRGAPGTLTHERFPWYVSDGCRRTGRTDNGHESRTRPAAH
jgi:hypothetical protein